MNSNDFITIIDIRVAGGAPMSKELQALINSTIFVQGVEGDPTSGFCLRGSVGPVMSYMQGPMTSGKCSISSGNSTNQTPTG